MNRTYRDILEAVAADYIPSDINLLPRLAILSSGFARGRKKTFLQTLRSRPILLILVVLLTLALSTCVAYVIGKSMGYLPGMGLVDLSTPVRVLKEPVRVQHGGIIIVVDQVIADSTRTVLQYHFDGYPFGPGDDFPIPVLRLENGKELASTGGGEMGWTSDSGRINTSNIFPPLPAHIQKVVLVFPNVDPMHKFGPTFNLEVPFLLIPAPKNFITPGVEIGVTAQESGPTFKTTASPTLERTDEYPTNWPPTPTRVPNGTGLYLDRIIEYEDSFLLIGNFTDAGDLPGHLMGVGVNDYDDPLFFTDAKGNRIPAWPRTDIQPASQSENSFYWAYEIVKPISFPLTMRVDYMIVMMEASATFLFDTGTNPHIGQTWKINQYISLLGVDYVFKEVTMTKTGYTFTTNNPPLDDRHNFNLVILEGMEGNDGEGFGVNPGFVEFTFNNGHIPIGKLTIELDCSLVVTVPGPWTLVWSPPGKP
jgi:hypothetical protein